MTESTRLLRKSDMAPTPVEFHYIEEELLTNSKDNHNMRQEKEREDLLKLVEQLVHYIKNDTVKKTLYPYLRSTLGAMLAQCRSIVDQADGSHTVPKFQENIDLKNDLSAASINATRNSSCAGPCVSYDKMSSLNALEPESLFVETDTTDDAEQNDVPN